MFSQFIDVFVYWHKYQRLYIWKMFHNKFDDLHICMEDDLAVWVWSNYIPGPGDSDAHAWLWLLNYYGWSWPSNYSMGIHSLSDCQVCGAVYTGNTCSLKCCSTISLCQGLVISLPYCYLNSEVQCVVQSHYNRWQLIRNVGRGHSPSPSVTASTTYSFNHQVF